ncbi:hypothetical protein TVAG_194140 [Trichomonas vaginalis G3]|uniref:Uncharacterized protein n=1 Tax=Trichomonas vaginalis (strain ATCC PRA-98 / G3) TaxID=412133 RepID=A2ES85_TRIV3|nr:hypothetical protein TVAGG3_0716580 [Trichomonas vaginalis G3]EAX88566.1 hypothetical protein TVAG_409180 [Trichomonas vaginalis G3]EAY04449.1 hypothetical protein TVAG_194140 [Trichomonas vaginalis G3]KAI5510294.1 hypothetical protein TVAGG3_0716580 [Trichomonas vaginalis G3]|eukprot:XP_001301496.1 hypothetical protein [Trichomonas vaginalis G3]
MALFLYRRTHREESTDIEESLETDPEIVNEKENFTQTTYEIDNTEIAGDGNPDINQEEMVISDEGGVPNEDDAFLHADF